MRMFRGAVVVLALALALGACRKEPSCNHRKIRWWQINSVATKVNDHIYMLRTQGSGLIVGNITVLTGPDGVLLVDTGFKTTASQVLTAIRRITRQPLRYAIITHWHGDHACGASKLHDAGAAIIAQEKARARMIQGSDWTPPPPRGGVPQITYDDTMRLHLDGEDIELIHPPDAHTAGDTMVLFKTSNVIATGDIFVNGAIPFIPTTAVSGVTSYIAAMERLLSVIDDKTLIIPGHGPISRRSDVEKSLAMLKDARQRVAALKAEGMDLDAIQKLGPLNDLDPTWGRLTYKAKDLTEWIYMDLSRDSTAPAAVAPP